MSTSSPEPVSTSDSAPSTPSADQGAPPAGQGRPQAHDDGAPVARAVDVADASRVRRAPRYGRFGFCGFLVGVVVSLVLALLPFAESQLSRGALFVLLLLALGTAGIFAGLTWALVSDRRSLRRRDGT